MGIHHRSSSKVRHSHHLGSIVRGPVVKPHSAGCGIRHPQRQRRTRHRGSGHIGGQQGRRLGCHVPRQQQHTGIDHNLLRIHKDAWRAAHAERVPRSRRAADGSGAGAKKRVCSWNCCTRCHSILLVLAHLKAARMASTAANTCDVRGSMGRWRVAGVAGGQAAAGAAAECKPLMRKQQSPFTPQHPKYAAKGGQQAATSLGAPADVGGLEGEQQPNPGRQGSHGRLPVHTKSAVGESRFQGKYGRKSFSKTALLPHCRHITARLPAIRQPLLRDSLLLTAYLGALELGRLQGLTAAASFEWSKGSTLLRVSQAASWFLPAQHCSGERSWLLLGPRARLCSGFATTAAVGGTLMAESSPFVLCRPHTRLHEPHPGASEQAAPQRRGAACQGCSGVATTCQGRFA